MKFRKKPIVIDAVKWAGNNLREKYYPCKPDIFEATYEAVTD